MTTPPDLPLTDLPVIDLAPLAGRPGSDALAGLAAAITDAAHDAGFFYIRNHGVPQPVIDAAFAANRRFHALPAETKLALRTNRWHRGYMGFGDARLTSSARFAAARRPNQMESFFVRHPVAPDHPDVAAGKPLQGPNQWPDDDCFRAAVTRYDEALRALGHRLLPVLSLAVGEAPDFFTARFAPAATALRLNHYPPAPADRPDDLYGSHPHTDYGFLTILAQDALGGLEVQAEDGGWRPAPPLPGTFVCNIGDALARWTNDAFASTPHRVINPSPERDRYSIAYFFDPGLDSEIACLARFCRDRPAAYPPVRFVDYFTERLDSNYVRVGAG